MNSDIYIRLKRELDKGNKAVVITVIDGGEKTGEAVRDKILLTEDQLRTSDAVHPLDSATILRAQVALGTGNLQYFQASKGVSILAEPYFPEPRLVVLGGGHIAKPLVEFGAKVGFLVTVVDDRPIFANKDRFPNAEKIICESFDNCFTQLNLNEYSFVVIMTREHRHDVACLEQLLNYKTAYIGMIGSKRSVDTVKQQLLQEGCSDALINQVNAPIGLAIGAVTPEEIAISIIAQAVSYRRLEGPSNNTSSDKANWPEFDRSVLEELRKDTGEPRALITIIATEGSAPRRPGTKMLVWPYGMTVGSIGGGYAEGEIINAAWQVIGTGGSKLHNIDMTGQTAEEEGMVCGGVMRVLIEDYHG
ncbi:MAG TPA: XdhC family protein [Bacillota bacterium]|nr:XdhC family protein [Bacillota bacterium]